MITAANSTMTPAMSGDLPDVRGEEFPWGSLVSRILHPVQVAVIEAMIWIELPVAPSDVCLMSGGLYSASHVAYHTKTLADRGVVNLVHTEQVRGATRHLYVLASESEWR